MSPIDVQSSIQVVYTVSLKMQKKLKSTTQRIISMATVCQHNDGGSCNVFHDESTYGDQDDF